MVLGLVLVAALLLVVVWIFALVDLIRTTDLDPVGRVILALALILAAPLGLLLWVVVRGGRIGLVAVATVVAGVALGVTSLATQSSPGVQTVSAPARVHLIR